MNESMTVILASRNAGKIRELGELLSGYGIQVLGLDAFPGIGEIEETGTTFEENALLKARTVAQLTGHIAIADDSGLEVDALDGAPGVYSARYGDDAPEPLQAAGSPPELPLCLLHGRRKAGLSRRRGACRARHVGRQHSG